VRAVFSWSYRHLDAVSVGVFRSLGLHPGADVEPYAVAALSGFALGQAHRALGQLARANLIQPGPPGRYAMHDLLRAYAGELAAEDGDAARAALTRLFDHYLAAAATAMDVLYPAERNRRPRITPSTGDTIPPVSTAAEAHAWLDAQRPTLISAAEHMVAHGWPGHAIRLAETLYRYLYSGSYHADAVAIHTQARRAARQTGERSAEARALNGLGSADQRQGRFSQAISHYDQALALFRDCGDLMGQARVVSNASLVRFSQGHYEQAGVLAQHALTLFQQVGDANGQAGALNNLGNAYEHQGTYHHATDCFQRAAALYRDCGNLAGQASALGNLGIVAEQQGRLEEAAARHRQALALAYETGHPAYQATALQHLGFIAFREERYQQSADYQLQALALYRENGERPAETDSLNALGALHLAAGRPDQARAWHTAELALAYQIGSKYHHARAHHGLGDVCRAEGDHRQARRHWQEALAGYASLDAPEADEVTARLAGP
jgi:tetratricopeptide (TPR) repeat protein